MQYKHEIKDTIWLIGLQGLNYIAPLLVWPYLIMVLGAEEFGKIGFSQSLSQYLMLIVDFGFNMTATKRIAQAATQEERDQIFGATILAKLCLLAISAMVLITICLIPRYHIYAPISVIMFTMVIGQTLTVYWLFQGLGKIRIISIVNTICKLAILPLTFIFVKSEQDVALAAWILSVVYLLSGLISIAIVLQKHWISHLIIVWNDAKEALKDSFPLFMSSAASAVYTALFTIILAYFASSQQVGCYTASEKIMRVVCFMIWMPLSQAFFPKVSQLALSDSGAAQRLFRKLMFLAALAMCLIGILMAMIAPTVVAWLGRSYEQMDRLLIIMALVPMAVAIAGSIGQFYLIAMGGDRERRQFRNVYFLAAAFSIILVIPLSYYLQSLGAAIALCCTEWFVACAMLYLYQKSK